MIPGLQMGLGLGALLALSSGTRSRGAVRGGAWWWVLLNLLLLALLLMLERRAAYCRYGRGHRSLDARSVGSSTLTPRRHTATPL